VVQVAWSDSGDEEWAQRPSGDGARARHPRCCSGPRLRHPGLAAARQVWTVLRRAPAGPVGLRLKGIGPRPAEDGVSPAIVR